MKKKNLSAKKRRIFYLLIFTISLINVSNITYSQGFELPNYYPFPGTRLSVPAPSDPIFEQNNSDKFEPRILEAKKGADGIWYCLVAWRMKSHDTTRKPYGRSIVRTYFYDPVWMSAFEQDNQFFSYINQPDGLGHYSETSPSTMEAVAYKYYYSYKGSVQRGGYVWLPANHLTETKVGIVTIGGFPPRNQKFLIPIHYTYKKGFLNLDRDEATYYVRANQNLHIVIDR